MTILRWRSGIGWITLGADLLYNSGTGPSQGCALCVAVLCLIVQHSLLLIMVAELSYIASIRLWTRVALCIVVMCLVMINS